MKKDTFFERLRGIQGIALLFITNWENTGPVLISIGDSYDAKLQRYGDFFGMKPFLFFSEKFNVFDRRRMSDFLGI